MNHPPLPRSEQGEASATPGSAGGLPLISRQEREFWRRAVDDERARLDLHAVGASCGPMPGGH